MNYKKKLYKFKLSNCTLGTPNFFGPTKTPQIWFYLVVLSCICIDIDMDDYIHACSVSTSIATAEGVNTSTL